MGEVSSIGVFPQGPYMAYKMAQQLLGDDLEEILLKGIWANLFISKLIRMIS